MTLILKQSTAVDVLIGPFVDITDAATAETGESPSVKLSKNGQALAAKSDATTPVHDASGYYNCELDATDTNTVGTLVLIVAASANALPVRHEFQVVEEATYNLLYASAADPVSSILTTQMTESYNTDGAAPTLAQALHLIMAYLMEKNVSGTTLTAKKLDGSTTAATFTLDDATTPTSITRAS